MVLLKIYFTPRVVLLGDSASQSSPRDGACSQCSWCSGSTSSCVMDTFQLILFYLCVYILPAMFFFFLFCILESYIIYIIYFGNNLLLNNSIEMHMIFHAVFVSYNFAKFTELQQDFYCEQFGMLSQ